MDSRMDLRLPIRLPVRLVTSADSMAGTTVDLSFGGTYIRLHPDWVSPLALYQRIQLHFEPGTAGVEVPAIIARHDGRGIGLMFGNYASAADDYLTDRISRFLTMQS